MRQSLFGLVLGVGILAIGTDASAAKKAPKKENPKKAAAAPASGDGLAAGVDCVLKAPLPVKIGVGKKAKSVKLSKDSRVNVREVGAVVLITTNQGDTSVKRAVLAKVCKVEAGGAAAGPTDAALETAQTAKNPEPTPTPAPAAQPTPVADAPPPSEAPSASPTYAAQPVQETIPGAQDPQRVEKLKKAQTIRTVAIVLTVVGAVGIAAGGTFLALALVKDGQISKQIDAYNAKPVRTQEEFDQINAGSTTVTLYRNVAIIAGAVGVASLVTGIVLFVVGENPKKYEEKTALHVTPTFMLAPGGASFGLVGTF